MKMKNVNRVLLAVIAATAISACTSSKGVGSGAEKMLNEKVDSSLTSSIQSISNMLNELSTINRGTNGVKDTSTALGHTTAGKIVAKAGTPDPKQVVTKHGEVVDKSKESRTKLDVDTKQVDAKSSKGQEVALATLDQKINLKWNGDAKNLLSSLSRKIGYTFSETGDVVSIPVKVSAHNQSIKDVFGLIDSQTSSKADIKISNVNKTVTLSYK